ncbi:SCO family protein [Alcaligenes aquatilis]|jgi:protein SCO1/2|uniref:SCO family protein n=1 Tax=Alcaligenes aquatilis TaxID=323284 RepID=A0ABY4NBE2_9BURK|nr:MULTISPECIES: SCO family protein [Alcaligenes]MCC9162466.1 SCO family protein [Alcaligenes sp. MMA]MCH4225297.1 SCO family protein [Alcaligenes faecalis]UQN34511.1 SCO family protein [Alcaligenes aquatilis]
MTPSPVKSILVLFKQFGLTLALGLFLLGSAAAANLHPVRGFLPDLRFSLQAAGSKTLTQDDFKDKVVMMFFGYASCPDICPTTLAQLGLVMEELGNDAEQVRIIFVSVDPHRDTPDSLARYIAAFDGKHTTGLTGSEKQIADLARRYRVAFQIEKPDPNAPENYEVSHSRGVYIFDQQGRARYLAPDTESVQVLADGVRSLLN